MISLMIVMSGIVFGMFGTLIGTVLAIIVIFWLNILSPINIVFVVSSAIASIIIALAIRRQ